METIEVSYNSEQYIANYFPKGKTWITKPCLEIVKAGKVIYKQKSHNTFILGQLFCEEKLIKLISNIE